MLQNHQINTTFMETLLLVMFHSNNILLLDKEEKHKINQRLERNKHLTQTMSHRYSKVSVGE